MPVSKALVLGGCFPVEIFPRIFRILYATLAVRLGILAIRQGHSELLLCRPSLISARFRLTEIGELPFFTILVFITIFFQSTCSCGEFQLQAMQIKARIFYHFACQVALTIVPLPADGII